MKTQKPRSLAMVGLLGSVLFFLVSLAHGDEPPKPVPGIRPSGSLKDLTGLERIAFHHDPSVTFYRKRLGNGETLTLPGPGVVVQMTWTQVPRTPTPVLTITLDGEPTPIVKTTLDNLAKGQVSRFPAPLARSASNTALVEVPIGFQRSCTMSLDGPATLNVTVAQLPDDQGLVSWSQANDPDLLKSVVKLWSSRELPPVPATAQQARYLIDSAARSVWKFALPSGPRLLLSCELRPLPNHLAAWSQAKISLFWDESREPALSLPVGDFFQLNNGENTKEPSRSDSWRQSGLTQPLENNGRESRWPMGYQRQAFLVIETKQPCKGEIRLRSLPWTNHQSHWLAAPDNLAYFHAKSVPIPHSPGLRIDSAGQGHSVGFMLLPHQQSPEWVTELDSTLSLFHPLPFKDYWLWPHLMSHQTVFDVLPPKPSSGIAYWYSDRP